MAVVMVIVEDVGIPNPEQSHPPNLIGKYLKSFDHEARNGFGIGKFTSDIRQAKRFANVMEAAEFWKRSPKCHPMRRSDGRPNRPLTAYTVTFEPAPDA